MTYGTYNYLSMTNVDVISCNKETQIFMTAVHEFIHAYLTKGSLYGNYLINMRQLNFIDEKYSKELKNSTNNWGNRKYKNQVIFDYLQKNMKILQEYAATLIECLYTKYKYGNNQFTQKKLEIYRPAWEKNIYASCIKKYGYLLEDEYLKSYLDYRLSAANSIDDTYKAELQQKDPSEAALDIMLASILQTAFYSLQIDLRYIEAEKWKSKQELKRHIEANQIEYVPSVRFNRGMEKTLPQNKRFSLEYPDKFLVDYADKSSLKKINFFSLKQRIDKQNEKVNTIHNNIILKETYEAEPYQILFVNELEKKALMTAMPAVLSRESIKKLFDVNHIEEHHMVINGNKENMPSYFWNHFEVLHIHPTTGVLTNEYRYLLTGNTIFNKNALEEEVTKTYHNMYYEETFDCLDSVCQIITNYIGELYISGCDRSEKLIGWILQNKPHTNIYLYTATSIAYSKWYITKYLQLGEIFMWKSYFKSYFLIIKNKRLFFIQQLIYNLDSEIKALFDNEKTIMNQDSFKRTYKREYEIINQIIKNSYIRMSHCKTYIDNKNN